MRVRHLLLLGLALAVSIVTARLLVLVTSIDQNRRLDEIRVHVAKLAHDATDLLILSQDHLLHGAQQSGRQWRSTEAGLVQALAAVAQLSPELRADALRAREAALQLPEFFDALESAAQAAGAEVQQRGALADRLVDPTRTINEAALELSDKVAAMRSALRKRDRDVTLATMAAFGTLTVLMALLVWRRVLAPAAELEAAANAVRAGNPERRSRYLTNDEFGDLSRSFDDMADALQQRNASLAAALRENDALLTTIRRHTIVSVADRKGTIIDANDSFCAISGYTREELIGRNHNVVNSGVQGRAFWVDMWRAIGAGQPWRGVICNRRKDGGLYWVDSIIAPFRDADGRIEKFVSIRNDITAAKQAEQQLAEGERFLRQITDGLPMRIAYVDAERRYRFANVAHCRRFERERDEIIGRTRSELKGEPEDAAVEARMLSALAGHEQRFEFDEVVEGGLRCIESRLIPDFDTAGKVRGVFTTGIDISDRKRSEQELLETSSLLGNVLDSATEVGIIAVTTDGTIRVFNRGAERMLGYDHAEVIGRESSLRFHDPDELDARATELTAQLGRPVHRKMVLIDASVLGKPQPWTYLHKNGRRIDVLLVVTAMQGADGTIHGYLGVSHDVSRQREYEESLRTAMQQARQANDAKTRFLANMSHEIRTPMNAVIGLSYLLGQTRMDREQAAFLAKIQLSSKTLLGLINDVLDLTKVEAGELTIERVPFKLHHLLKDLENSAGVQAEAKGIAFGIEADDDLPNAAEGDPTRLGQILSNLLTNAIKFTQQGRVRLHVKRLKPPEGEAGEAGKVWLRFVVHDTGIGIAPDVQALLFTPFSQADSSITRRFGGTGLGLSIVKRLVELMQGRLTLHSVPGEGSEFGVELPFTLVDPAVLATLPSGDSLLGRRSLSGVRLLVVDDSDINREVAKRILELEGARVQVAEDGEAACAALRATPQAFHLVLMDVQMPGLDGYQATRVIREELGLRELPVVALTAAVLTSEIEHARAAGMNGHISKPFDPKALVRAIHGLLALEGAARIGEPDPSAAPPAARWPEIDGIDVADASERLGGDLALFLSMLRRLLDEFGHGGLAGAASGERLAAHAARLHKLRGAAGTIGAKNIQALAGDAEAACRDGDASHALPLLDALADELASLSRAAAPVLDAAQADSERADAQADAAAAALDGRAAPTQTHAPGDAQGDVQTLARAQAGGAPAAGASPDSRAVQDLLEMLRRQDLSALARFGAAAPELRRRLGAQEFGTLRRMIDDLKFAAAADLIDERLEAGG